MSRVREHHQLPLVWLFLFIALSAAPGLKFGDIQVLEVLQSLRLLVVICFFLSSGLKIPASGVWRRYAGPYGLFLVACFVLSLISLRLSFYPPPDLSVIKSPLIASLSRLVELAMSVYFMSAVADTLSLRPDLTRISLDVYATAGAFSAFVSVISVLLWKLAGVSSFAVYGEDLRIRGFFNEGGPYGLFLVSVILVLLLRVRLFPPRRFVPYRAALCLLFLALVLSESRAGLLVSIALYALAIIASPGRRQRMILVGLSPVLLLICVLLLQARVNSYTNLYSNFAEALVFHSEDPNLVMGRISAFLIVPRMIAAHPVLGIGIANYSLMRNDPDYLQGLPAVDKWDLPGLGLFGSTAELGIPLALLLLWLLLKPLRHARRLRAPLILVLVAAFQPLASLSGVNLNFFYPWLVTAFILPLVCPAQKEPGTPPRSRDGEVLCST